MASADRDCTLAFRGELDRAQEYPNTIVLSSYSKKVVDAYTRHFKTRQERLFKVEDEAKRPKLVIRDYGFADQDPGLAKMDNIDTIIKNAGSVHFRMLLLPNFELLRARLGWSEDPGKQLPQDPKCRFIVCHTTNADSLQLHLTKPMLMFILTYHQVSPCYLNFVACLDSSTGLSELQFGGFQSYSFVAQPAPLLKHPERSGHHYQLNFCLQAVLPDPDDNNETWRKHPAAIHHQFDVMSGRALWIITSPQEGPKNRPPENNLWNEVRGSIRDGDHAAQLISPDARERFQGSLEVVQIFAEWSLGECSFYAQHLEEGIVDLGKLYLIKADYEENAFDPGIIQRDLRALTNLMEDLRACEIQMNGNKSVLDSVNDFYVKQLALEIRDPRLKLEWVESAQTDISRLSEQLKAIVGRTDQVLKRLSVLEKMALSRQELIQKLLDNGQNIKMGEQSTAMKRWSLITLILLPITVISTILSTDIVKFQGLTNPDGGTSGAPVYSFSVAAFGTWAVAGLVLTGVCLTFSTDAWLKFSTKSGAHISNVASTKLPHTVGPALKGAVGGSSTQNDTRLHRPGAEGVSFEPGGRRIMHQPSLPQSRSAAMPATHTPALSSPTSPSTFLTSTVPSSPSSYRHRREASSPYIASQSTMTDYSAESSSAIKLTAAPPMSGEASSGLGLSNPFRSWIPRQSQERTLPL